MTVVTNYSDLPPGVKELLLAGSLDVERVATRTARLDAAVTRGLAVRTDPSGDRRYYRLTDRGVAAAEQLRSLVAPTTIPHWQAELYPALRRAAPALTNVARHVAQLRRWATEPVTGEWEQGRQSAWSLAADQLERDVLGDLAPLLMPEAVRRDAEAQITSADIPEG